MMAASALRHQGNTIHDRLHCPRRLSHQTMTKKINTVVTVVVLVMVVGMVAEHH